MFAPATSKTIHRQAYIGDIAKHDFQYVPLQPEEQRGWCCLTNRFSMVKVIHITYLSFGLFLDFASHEIVYSFCIM